MANGLKLRGGPPRRHSAGRHDPAGRQRTPGDFATIAPGTGSLAMSLLDEGTTTRTAAQLTEALAGLGATLQAGGGGGTSSVSLSALKPTLEARARALCRRRDESGLCAKDLDRLKAQSIAGIAAAKQDPSQAAGRILPGLIFGPDNAYGRLATPASIGAIDRAAVTAFHDRWFHPNNATLVVTGDTSLAEIRPLIEAAFAGWTAGAGARDDRARRGRCRQIRHLSDRQTRARPRPWSRPP